MWLLDGDGGESSEKQEYRLLLYYYRHCRHYYSIFFFFFLRRESVPSELDSGKGMPCSSVHRCCRGFATSQHLINKIPPKGKISSSIHTSPSDRKFETLRAGSVLVLSPLHSSIPKLKNLLRPSGLKANSGRLPVVFPFMHRWMVDGG